MKVVLSLPHTIQAFALQPEQLARLQARHPQHQWLVAADEPALLQQLPDAAVVLVWRFSAAWYGLGPQLRFVATPAAGREKVEADPSGRVRVIHASFHGKIMAESLLAMMLYFTRRFDLALADQRAHHYGRDQYSTTRRLAGQRALIVGYGALGRECARLLKAVGMHVTGVKRRLTDDTGPADAVHAIDDLPNLLGKADHVIATLPADTGTDHLFDDSAFRAMRPSTGFYNLGRGNAVDETALLRALHDGALAHAFLDVFEREPLPPDSPLWDAPRLALTPHASASNSEYLDLWFAELAPHLDALT